LSCVAVEAAEVAVFEPVAVSLQDDFGVVDEASIMAAVTQS